MKKSKHLNSENNFLNDFIKGEMYLQNPPMKTDEFIEFCKKLGLKTTKDELEYFEKEKLLFPILRIERPVGEEERIKLKKEDGRKYSRLASEGLQEGETEIEQYKEKYYSSYGFSEYHKDLLINWVQEGILYYPSTKEFQSWNNFLGEELENGRQKIISFYSSFQVFWLEILINSFTITINLAGDKKKISSNITLVDIFNTFEKGEGIFDLDNIENFATKLKETSKEKIYDLYFDMEKKKQRLLKDYKKFNKLLKLLLSTQSIYFPYFKSGGGTIWISGDSEKWREAKRNFDLKPVLINNKLKIQDVAKWYYMLSEKTQNILGIKRDDWVQLWKNIDWRKKEKLDGSSRLGVEYLQCAIMLKRIIEGYRKKDILDIDEMDNIRHDDVLKIEPSRIDHSGWLLRANRNVRYSDNEKNYYHDRYKRSFYLANSFGIDYQPRVMVFVEGRTEEILFPEIFEWYVGNTHENYGIEFININGIARFFGQKISIPELNNKYLKGFINNYNNLVSYNLSKWQIIPFFIGDNENQITTLLNDEISISFNKNPYPFPKKWQYIWGISNSNIPFKGKDFEMANFNDDEIASVLNNLTKKQITVKQVADMRNYGKGIEQIDKAVHNKKIKIAQKLIENLFNEYKDEYANEKNRTIFERPVFKAMFQIANIAKRNYPPADRQIELANIKYIEDELKGKI